MLLQDITAKRKAISDDLLEIARECRDYGDILSMDISEAPTLPLFVCYLHQKMQSDEHATIPTSVVTRRLPAMKTRERQFISV